MKCISVVALFLTILVTGCIKEDVSDCPEKGYSFIVKAYDNDGKELTSEDVGDVVMFIFDGEKRFVEQIRTNVGVSVTIIPPDGGDMHIVAWGNLAGGNQNVPQFTPGTPMDESGITLLCVTRTVAYGISPDDLFRGYIYPTNEEMKDEHLLPIYRETGNMDITIRNLKGFTGYEDDDYSVVVRETYSGIDFSGNLYGDKVAYRPAGAFVTNGGREEFFIPLFNMIPESEIYIDIYHGAELITSVSVYNGDQPITVEKGLTTHVLIELKSSVTVIVSITPWGEEAVWKEF